MQIVVSTRRLDHGGPISWRDNHDAYDWSIVRGEQSLDATDDHLKPAKEESELDCEEEGVEQVQLRLRVSHREAVSLLGQ